MNLITHALVGWSLASLLPSASRAQKTWIVAASVAPDVDGLGLVFELATRHEAEPLTWWSRYHHVVAHNLPFAALLALAAWTATRRALIAGVVCLAVHLHLLCDLIGSRGPEGAQWPIAYLWPLSLSPQLAVDWQWRLNAWPNLLLSLVLLVATLRRARDSGTSPLALVSDRANRSLVAALRGRFPLPHARQPSSCIVPGKETTTMAKVLGVGGVFFRSPDPAALCAWYRKWLGVAAEPPTGAMFMADGMPEGGLTLWSPFPRDTSYFGTSGQTFMINLIVDDVRAALAQVREGGASVDEKIDDQDYGVFGWFTDPDGNRVELWQPKG